MAFAFNGTSQYISGASRPVAAYGMTFFARLKTSSSATQNLIAYGNNTKNDPVANIAKSNANYVVAGQRNTAALDVSSVGTINIADDVWHGLTGVFASASSVTSYTDDVASTTSTTNITSFPSPLNTFSLGAIARTTISNYANGSLADCAIWSVALTAEEIASLAKGFKPTRIRPQSLEFYAPLIRDLQDITGAMTLTNSNSATAANHPRVY